MTVQEANDALVRPLSLHRRMVFRLMSGVGREEAEALVHTLWSRQKQTEVGAEVARVLSNPDLYDSDQAFMVALSAAGEALCKAHGVKPFDAVRCPWLS